MDARSTGVTIAKLRRAAGMTQAQLGERLNISGKTVSRWESGLGFPEVMQFPELAKLFGAVFNCSNFAIREVIEDNCPEIILGPQELIYKKSQIK